MRTFGRIASSSDPHKRMRFLDADGFDEQMGMGRDSRTLASGLSDGQILAEAMNALQAMIAAHDPECRLAVWADMLVRDHNGGQNYSWLAGAGRQQGYWPAIELVDRRILPGPCLNTARGGGASLHVRRESGSNVRVAGALFSCCSKKNEKTGHVPVF